MHRNFIVWACLLLPATPCLAEDSTPCRTVEELRQRIQRILSQNGIPGATLAVTDREKPLVLAGFGKADVATGRSVTPETPFRMGSTSKTFVALAVLTLVEEGRLDLQAPVRSLVPDVRFENRWESTHPVRVVHLLEHTTGWDEISLKEYAHSDPKPLTLAEGLAIGSASRASRWRPGTRYSYCNAGPAVAAAIVEKITGRRFEDYVEERFFRPIGMATSDYFLSERSAPLITRLYRPDGRTPFPYHHICLRPSGGLNASATDMSAYLRFFLNRGMVGSERILPEQALRRMETPTTYWGAQAGLATGYGLGNYTSLDDRGFVWHGHGGGVEGGQTELAYLPKEGVGVFFSINAQSSKAFEAISEEVKAFATKDLARPVLSAPRPIPKLLQDEYTGWYRPDSPRMQFMSSFEGIQGLAHCRFERDRLHLKQPLLGSERTYVAASERTFRLESRSAASLALMDTEEGRLVQTSGVTLMRVPTALAWMAILLSALFLLAVASVPLFALVWGPRWLLGRMKGIPNLHVRVLPLLAVLSLGGIAVEFLLAGDDFFVRFGRPTPWSMGFTVLTWTFAAFSLAGLWSALRADRRHMNRRAFLHGFVVSALLTAATLYLAWHGIIGLRPWS